MKKLHDKYQTKFLLNLFKGDQNSGFMLEEFPDCYKAEFAANSDWLRFSFHAAFDKTHYFDYTKCIAATAEEFIRDYNYVKQQVTRFAGEECFLFPQIVHYVESSPEIKRFLFDEGVRFLCDRRTKFEALSAEAGHTVVSVPDADVPELPPIIPDHDIIIMSDEAHRSQYGIFADNMCRLLPTASRIGFTGTPLLANDNITRGFRHSFHAEVIKPFVVGKQSVFNFPQRILAGNLSKQQSNELFP